MFGLTFFPPVALINGSSCPMTCEFELNLENMFDSTYLCYTVLFRYLFVCSVALESL